jgi:hypothetical protein
MDRAPWLDRCYGAQALQQQPGVESVGIWVPFGECWLNPQHDCAGLAGDPGEPIEQ